MEENKPDDPAPPSNSGTQPAATSNSPQSKHRSLPGDTRHAILKKSSPPSPIEILLGCEVINAAGEKVSPGNFVAEDGVIGLYFAAKWCPPCRKLFPELMLLYEEVKKSGIVNFEVIFVSFDRSQESFNEYVEAMPWWAVDFQEEEKRENLAETFRVHGIPLLVLLDVNTLEVITRHAVEFMRVDPRGAQFPWRGLPRPSHSTGPRADEAVVQALSLLASVAHILAADEPEVDTTVQVQPEGEVGQTHEASSVPGPTSTDEQVKMAQPGQSE